MRTRCLSCREWATHNGRCTAHHKGYENARSVQSHSKRRDAIARGTNAAALLRKAVRKAVSGTCAVCLTAYLPSQVDIDHIIPLARGGEDVEGNVQILCKHCHKAKTAMDFGKRPF